jgi:hypothetical protein
MSNKQTAVEWLICELIEYGLMHKDILPSHPIFKKAKEMEKQQIIDAYMGGTAQFANDARIDYPKTPEQYYNETFKNE